MTLDKKYDKNFKKIIIVISEAVKTSFCQHADFA
jgi:hypothetical protein